MAAAPKAKPALAAYLQPHVLVMLVLGFSSGLPFVLTANTFGYWLAEEHTSLSAIGFLSWVGFAYTLKWLWAPILDRMGAPLLFRMGRRRSWIAFSQIIVGLGLIAMALSGTGHGLVQLGVCALVVAFASSTQDIAIDAFRIESANNADEQGLLISAYTIGYRVALIASDSIILFAATRVGWPTSYILYGLLMLAGLTACLFAKEPVRENAAIDPKNTDAPLWSPRGFFDAVTGPFFVFFKQHGAFALVMLLAITLYQLPNFVSGPIYGPLYVKIGLTKDMVGAVRGTFGLLGTYAGVVAGGFLSVRLGLIPAVLFGCVGEIVGTALYAILPYAHDTATFTAVMLLDNFGLGVAGVALVAYMSTLTSRGYTATQYAILTSTYALTGKFLKGFSGAVVDGLTPHIGLMNAFAAFFIGCGLIGIPSMLLFIFIARHQRKTQVSPA